MNKINKQAVKSNGKNWVGKIIKMSEKWGKNEKENWIVWRK